MEQKLENGFVRKLIFHPAYDRRDSDPKKNYGIHNMELSFVLIGPMGAVDFAVHKTEWYTASAREHLRGWPATRDISRDADPWLASVNYHSLVPQYEGQEPTKNCSYLGGRPCFCDGTSLKSDLMERFVCEGEEPVWKELEEWYDRRLRDSLAPEI